MFKKKSHNKSDKSDKSDKNKEIEGSLRDSAKPSDKFLKLFGKK